MSRTRFIAEVDRLFEQLVHDPWLRPRAPARRGDTELTVAVPVRPSDRGDVSVAIAGHRLVVRVAHRDADAVERVVSLPEDREVVGLDAHFDDGTLHVRVRLEHRRD